MTTMLKILLLVTFLGLSSTNEHWFVFDQYQFPGFYTSLFTLNSSKEKSLSFALSTYDRSIMVDINNETIKLNIERADLLSNTINHMIFIVLRNENQLETYVNCKLIDSYLFYSSTPMDENSSYRIKTIAKNVEHYEITATNSYTQQEIFDKFSCKQTDTISTKDHNSTSTTLGRPLIRKMQHVIENIQRHKLRSRRQNNQHHTSLTLLSDSLTLIYKPNIDNNASSHIIFNISQLSFHIQYYPHEHLFNIQFNNENRTQFLLYADKSTDRISSSNNNLILFLHITSTMVTCYVNCELIDQEFILDTFYIQNLIHKIMNVNKNQYEYNRQSTLILFNKSIDQIAEQFFCSKLDKKNQDLLPDKYALRKFTNALDMLVDSLDSTNEKIQNISTVNLPSINGFGSFKVHPTLETLSKPNQMLTYDKSCSTDNDCETKKSSMKCHFGHCMCPKSFFWSSVSHRCILCHDILFNNRCFRLSNHKSTWYEANDYCQDEEGQEYSMKLASNLNRTDIQYLKQNFLHDNDHEHIDYMYWLGATSHFDTRKLHQHHSRTKRQVPTTIFRWYDNGETAQLNFHELWCSQMDYLSLTTINNNQLCVSLTSCGLYADDCQRNYRFLCEAV